MLSDEQYDTNINKHLLFYFLQQLCIKLHYYAVLGKQLIE